MTTQAQLLTGARPSAQATSIFRRVLVGVDPSPESREAVRQGAVLVDPAGALTLLAVWTLPPPIVGAELPPASLEEEPSRRAAEVAVANARAAVGPFGSARTKVARGFAWDALVAEIEQEAVTLGVVGSQ